MDQAKKKKEEEKKAAKEKQKLEKTAEKQEAALRRKLKGTNIEATLGGCLSLIRLDRLRDRGASEMIK
ncbi:hypothetical protein KXD40_002926 [Peronospora effusa]|uniref:Uncharacterized protein n=1 Tax=Peronospora effusa TaxID=542832 RepID=A0A3M6VC87_9STRA|nr:hypothetical protein DD238_005828 [Peronospora effusa]RQM14741.1 hypothetical protein DD237_002205 [Peronospora effusa]UIZ29231.1 hypothetical protein KXD40_002926 [Peronospora effusa]